MNTRHAVGGLFASLLVIMLAGQAPATSLDSFHEHVEGLTQDGGVWVASNSRYQSDREPFDAYKLVWRKGIGGLSAYGRMTALRGLEETAPIWEFLLYWDSELRQVRVIQFSSSDIVGKGVLTISEKGEEELIQNFYPPNGEPYRVRHTGKLQGDVHETISYKRAGEEWEPNRSYIWVRRGAVPPTVGNQP